MNFRAKILHIKNKKVDDETIFGGFKHFVQNSNISLVLRL